ncbi:MAG: LysR substrate-binding domain-containing protein [Woeseiaceae bacterium]|jgi:DNA-binding transcriptional LysR family regulator|nr:LysR substrate-binding domain-containing protein [Woeseiaceae bacterium]
MISKQRVSLKELRTFCVAAQNASFRDTAEVLFITPSAVSHQIKGLEESLNVELFERLTRSIRLTEAGRGLYADLCPVIARLDEVVETHRRATTRNALRISLQPFFATELFLPMLGEFTGRHPEIDIKVDTNDESLEKHPASADVSIRIFRKAPDDYVWHRLFPLRLVPAVSPDIEARVRKGGLDALAELPRLVHESRPNAWRQWERVSGVTLPEMSRVVRLDSMTAVAQAAERGVGTALVPLRLSDSRFESRTLVPLFTAALEMPEAYYLVYRREDADNHSIQTFRDWALEKFDDSGQA